MRMRPLLPALALVAALPAAAQEAPPRWGEPPPASRPGEAAEALVKDLNALIEQARTNRSADPRFLDQLSQLARRHSWPWDVTVVHDAFRDGNYTADPSWSVARGNFWIDRQLGLRSAVDTAPQVAQAPAEPAADNPALEVLGSVLGELARRQQQGQQAAAPADQGGPAEIFVPQPFANSFAIHARIAALASPGRLEIGPYQGEQRNGGYRLAWSPQQGLELLRLTGSGSAVIEASRQPAGTADGSVHDLTWTRAADGTMTVAVDGRPVLTTVDRGIQQGFAGLVMANYGGDFAVREVRVETVRQ